MKTLSSRILPAPSSLESALALSKSARASLGTSGRGISGGRTLSRHAFSLACVMLALFLAAPARAQTITQGEWARRMVSALGLEDQAVPRGAPASDYVEFLSGDPIPPLRIEGASAAPIPAGARVEPVAADPHLRALRAGAANAAAFYRVSVPVGGVYALRMIGEGGAQRWRLDGGRWIASPPADPSEPLAVLAGTPAAPVLPEPKLVGYFVLSRGNHTASVEIPSGGVLAAFELVRQPFPHVRPPGGWASGEALTFGVKAVTMVQLMQLEDQLPDVPRASVAREGERFEASRPARSPIGDRSPGTPSAGAWMRGGHGGAALSYQVELGKPCVYSVVARMTGRGSARFRFDGSVERSVTPPGAGERFAWLRVSTLPLNSGPHRVDVRLGDGVGLDSFKLICRDPDPEASLLLLRDLGFEEKFPNDTVTAPFAAGNLDRPYFRERMQSLLSSFFVSTGPGPLAWGPGAGPEEGVVLPSEPSDISPAVP